MLLYLAMNIEIYVSCQEESKWFMLNIQSKLRRQCPLVQIG